MTTLSLPLGLGTSVESSHARWRVLWLGLFLFAVFFACEHNWSASQKWKSTRKGDVQNLVDRLSEGNALRQLSFVALGAFGMWGVIRPARQTLCPDLLIVYPLVLLTIWATASVLWSQDPLLTLKRLVVYYSISLALLAMVRQFTLDDLARLGILACLGFLLIGVIAEGTVGTYGIWGTHDLTFSEYRFAGTHHPNHTGATAVVMMLLALYFAEQTGGRRFLLLAGFSLLVVLLTKSRTALLGGLAGSAVFIALRWPVKRIFICALLATIVLSFFTMIHFMDSQPAVWEALFLGRADSDPTTLTGRTAIWEFAIRQLCADPTRLLVGFGYDTFWTPEMTENVSKFVKFKISEGHCAYLDATLELGLAGSGCYVIALLGTLFRSVSANRRAIGAGAALVAGLVGFALVHGLAESASVDPHFATFVLFGGIAFTGMQGFPAGDRS